MSTKLVNVRLPEQLYKQGREVVDSAGYANFQELVKDSLRHTIHDIKKDQAILKLQKSFGSTHGKKRKLFTPEVKNMIAEELAKNLNQQKELFRKVGL